MCDVEDVLTGCDLTEIAGHYESGACCRSDVDFGHGFACFVPILMMLLFSVLSRNPPLSMGSAIWIGWCIKVPHASHHAPPNLSPPVAAVTTGGQRVGRLPRLLRHRPERRHRRVLRHLRLRLPDADDCGRGTPLRGLPGARPPLATSPEPAPAALNATFASRPGTCRPHVQGHQGLLHVPVLHLGLRICDFLRRLCVGRPGPHDPTAHRTSHPGPSSPRRLGNLLHTHEVVGQGGGDPRVSTSI